jgi:predicted phage-related endonuclease
LSVYIIDRDDVWHYPILRNEDFINNLVEKERDFWEGFFIPGVMPAAAGIDSEDSMITGLFNGGASPLRLGEEEALMCEDYVEINRRTEELEKRKKAVAVKLKEAIIRRLPPSSDPSACGKVSAAAGHYRVSWSRVETSRVDTEALKKAGIYEKYVKKSESGRFSITEKKEG